MKPALASYAGALKLQIEDAMNDGMHPGVASLRGSFAVGACECLLCCDTDDEPHHSVDPIAALEDKEPRR